MRAAISDLLDDVTQPHGRLSSAKSFRVVLIQKTGGAEVLEHSSFSSENLGHSITYEQHNFDDRILGEPNYFKEWIY